MGLWPSERISESELISNGQGQQLSLYSVLVYSLTIHPDFFQESLASPSIEWFLSSQILTLMNPSRSQHTCTAFAGPSADTYFDKSSSIPCADSTVLLIDGFLEYYIVKKKWDYRSSFVSLFVLPDDTTSQQFETPQVKVLTDQFFMWPYLGSLENKEKSKETFSLAPHRHFSF